MWIDVQKPEPIGSFHKEKNTTQVSQDHGQGLNICFTTIWSLITIL